MRRSAPALWCLLTTGLLLPYVLQTGSMSGFVCAVFGTMSRLLQCVRGQHLQAWIAHLLQPVVCSPWQTQCIGVCASLWLWSQFPASLRQPRTNLSYSDSPCLMNGTSSTGSINSPLSSSISPSLFHSGLKPSFSANPSGRSHPFLLQD